MLRTLHTYIGKDLVKVALLSLLAFTLMMTVFAVIEPLRKRGLELDEALALVGYTLPMMLSFTLPIAALFAATMVYGRFSQDNELMACRAGGVSTVTLLKSAGLLGVIVTLVSLWLLNFLIPHLTERAESVVKANVRGIIYSELNKQGYVRRDKQVVHAARVHPDQDALEGIVAVDTTNPDNLTLVSARAAQVTFDEREGETYVSVRLRDPAAVRTGSMSIFHEDVQPSIGELRLANPLRESPAWYSWDRLVRTLNRPWLNRDIRRELNHLKDQVASEEIGREIRQSLQATGRYDQLRGAPDRPAKRVELQAPRSRLVDGQVELLSVPGGTDKPYQPVRAVVTEANTVLVIEADTAKVRSATWPMIDLPVVSVEFSEGVRSRKHPRGMEPNSTAALRWTQMERMELGGLALPAEVAQRITAIDPAEFLSHPEKYTKVEAVQKRIAQIWKYDIRKLQGKILGELHGRTAYGLSCFLLVFMGAAMGLLFRGGQVLSAFALSMIPAAVVIVMILMGKEMLANPDVPLGAGLAAIWGGDVALLIGNVFLHVQLTRR